MTCKIYALIDPAEPGTVRYVGKTTLTLPQRLRDHLRKATDLTDTSHRCNWIRKVRNEGRKPQILLLAEVEDDQVDQAERDWIGLYRQAGADLVNATDGGDGGKKMAPHVVEKMRAATTAQFQDPDKRARHRAALLNSPVFRAAFEGEENLRRITATNRRVWADPERRRKASETHKARWADPERYEAWQAAVVAARANRPRVTHCRRSHEFEAVGYYVTKTGAKVCRECHRMINAENYRRRRDGLPNERRQYTHCIHGHELTEENTARGINGVRKCRQCNRINMARAIEKRKSRAPRKDARPQAER